MAPMAGTLEATPAESQPWTGAHLIAHRVAVADDACVRIGGVVAGAAHDGHPDARTGALLLRQRRTGVVRRVPLDLSDGTAHATLDAGFLAPGHDGPPVWDLFASFDRAPEQPVTGVEGAVGAAGAQLVARRRGDGAERSGAAALDGDAFTAELPLGALAAPGDADE